MCAPLARPPARACRIVLVAFACTATIFGCFSAAALLSKRRSFLFLGGWCSSTILALSVMRLCSWLVPGLRGMALDAELTIGLLCFSGYVVFDTQVRCGAVRAPCVCACAAQHSVHGGGVFWGPCKGVETMVRCLMQRLRLLHALAPRGMRTLGPFGHGPRTCVCARR